MDTGRETIEKIQELVEKNLTIEINGTTFSKEKLQEVKKEKQKIEKINLSTLDGLSNYLTENPDNIEICDLIIIIKSYNKIILTTKLNNNIRDVFLTVEPQSFDIYPFSKWMDIENFIIKLQSMFKETKDRTLLLQYVSRLTQENNVQYSDDGITQTATLKKGISGALTSKEKLPSIVKLKPYRTFLEIDQPESIFLFRIRNENNLQCALFEADACQWKNTAAHSIKGWLENENIVSIILI